MIETDEDRRAFLSDFGRPAMLFAGQPGARAVVGLFDRDYVAADPDTGADVSSYGPALRCLTSDLAGLEHDAPIEVDGGGLFRVGEIKPDGEGFTLVILYAD